MIVFLFVKEEKITLFLLFWKKFLYIFKYFFWALNYLIVQKKQKHYTMDLWIKKNSDYVKWFKTTQLFNILMPIYNSQSEQSVWIVLEIAMAPVHRSPWSYERMILYSICWILFSRLLTQRNSNIKSTIKYEWYLWRKIVFNNHINSVRLHCIAVWRSHII